jgi:hypothetical protein
MDGKKCIIITRKTIDPIYKEIRPENHTISDACRLVTDQTVPYCHTILPIKVILGADPTHCNT